MLYVLLVYQPAVHAEAPNYEEHIKPLFRSHCLKCHNADESNADLDLSSFAALMKGGSSGAVVKAGRPESSQLYRAMAHLENAEAMPPESPKLAEAKIELVRDWIRSGLIAGKGGRSLLRSVGAMLAPSEAGTPAPVPTNLPDVPLTKVVRPPIPQALAASPGASLFAVSGQEQILLYGKKDAPSTQANFTPTVDGDLIRRWQFETPLDGRAAILNAGRIGKGHRFNSASKPHQLETNVDFDSFEQLTISIWIRPTSSDGGQTIFGQENGFSLFLERRRDGWTPRLYMRDQDNGISYYGRVAFLPDDQWSHLAATWNGRKWSWFANAEFIAEQECPTNLKRIQQRPESVQSIGGQINSNGQAQNLCNCDVDELRIYRRALSPLEIAAMISEVTPTYGVLGALPFPEGTIHDVKFSRNGALILAAGGRGAHSGRVVVYDVKTGKRVAEIGDEVESVLAADITAHHDFVALGGPGKLVKIFKTSIGELVHKIDKHTDWVTAMSFSPDGSLLATGDRSGGIHIWETDKGAIVFTLDEHKVRITDLAWRADSKLLASGAEDGNLILWDMKDGFPSRNIVAHASKESPRYSRRTGVTAVDFAPDGRILTVGRDGFGGVWSTGGDQQGEFQIDGGIPTAAAIFSGGTAAVVGSFDGSLSFWDLGSNARTQTIVNGGGIRND